MSPLFHPLCLPLCPFDLKYISDVSLLVVRPQQDTKRERRTRILEERTSPIWLRNEIREKETWLNLRQVNERERERENHKIAQGYLGNVHSWKQACWTVKEKERRYCTTLAALYWQRRAHVPAHWQCGQETWWEAHGRWIVKMIFWQRVAESCNLHSRKTRPTSLSWAQSAQQCCVQESAEGEPRNKKHSHTIEHKQQQHKEEKRRKKK